MAPSAGRATSAQLSFPIPTGYTADPSYARAFGFANGVTAVTQEALPKWFSVYAAGVLERKNFGGPEEATETVIRCIANSPGLYDPPGRRQDLRAEAVTVDGAPAYSITAEILVDQAGAGAEGDRVQVIVADTGDDDRLGVFVSIVPMGDKTRIDQQAATAALLKVEGAS